MYSAKGRSNLRDNDMLVSSYSSFERTVRRLVRTNNSTTNMSLPISACMYIVKSRHPIIQSVS